MKFFDRSEFILIDSSRISTSNAPRRRSNQLINQSISKLDHKFSNQKLSLLRYCYDFQATIFLITRSTDRCQQIGGWKLITD